jgi:hypothetical protein
MEFGYHFSMYLLFDLQPIHLNKTDINLYVVHNLQISLKLTLKYLRGLMENTNKWNVDPILGAFESNSRCEGINILQLFVPHKTCSIFADSVVLKARLNSVSSSFQLNVYVGHPNLVNI